MEDNKTPQAEGVSTPEAQPEQDRFTNFQKEMGRKYGNLEETNKQLANQLAQIQQMLAQKQAAPVAEKPLSEVWYDKPEEAARRIKEETAAEIRKEMQANQQQQAKQAQTINSLMADFPELADSNHDLTRKAIEIFNSMPEEERVSPLAYKAAVKEAALELDVKPKSKRKAAAKAEESFSLGGSSGNSPRRSDSDMDKARAQLAERFGLKVTPELKEKLKKHSAADLKRWG